MARKQVGLKFEEEDLARWDQFAESQGLTRTTLVETAVERLIDVAQKQAPGKETRSPVLTADSEPTRGRGPVIEPQQSQAKPGVRRAWICANDKCQPPYRRFLTAEDPQDFVPACPEHGRMVQQENKPYMGQTTI